MARLALVVVAVLALVLVASAANDMSIRAAFGRFVQQYGRKYASVQETKERLAIFAENMKKCDALNKEYPKAQFGVNKFSDMSETEFRAKYLMQKGALAKRQEPAFPAPVVPPFEPRTLPANWFWGPANLTSPVKNQEQCGSCWAFSATEQVESMYALAHGLEGKVPTLSVEQIVQCDHIAGVQGCNGGYSQSAFEYVIAAGGLESDSTYPYTSGAGVTGSCSFKKQNIVANITSWQYVTSETERNETQLQYYIAEVAPVSICVDASIWQYYTGGVVSWFCASSPNDLDHCVQLVGYGASAGILEKVPYWIVRNSWGSDWGVLDGYIFVERGGNYCGIGDVATTAVV
jgi:hypothetical protein